MKLLTLPLTALVAALLGAGIAIGVMAVWEPWDDTSVSQADIERLSQEIADLSESVSEATPSSAELDARKCTAALEAAGSALSRTTPENRRGPTVPTFIQDIITEHC